MTPQAIVHDLKKEAGSIRLTGISQVFTEGALNDLGAKQLLPQLSVASTPKEKVAEKLAEAESANIDFMSRFEAPYLNEETMTTPFNIDREMALHSYCDFVEALAVEETDVSFGVVLRCQKSGDLVVGGFSTPYDTLLDMKTRYNKKEQAHCCWAWVKGKWNAFSKSSLRSIQLHLCSEAVISSVNQITKAVYAIERVHMIGQWSNHAIWNYHKDDDGSLTVILNLSPGSKDFTSFHIAGASEKACFSNPGDCHLFPSKIMHRTDTATMRTVKVAFFLKKVKVVDVSEETPDASASEAGPSTVVKQEKEERAPLYMSEC